MSSRWAAVSAAAVVAALSHAPAFTATTPSGSAIAVIQSSEADGVTGRRMLAPAAPVYAGDRINTGGIGEAQLRFRDGTRLVVGPNSSMVLDAFVLGDNNTASEVAINAVRGAFRFISGNGPRDAYAITTPTATISVRGTAFDVSVDSLGTTRAAVIDGGIINCDRLPPPQRTCIFQTAVDCEVIITENGRLPRYAARGDRRRELLTYFPYFRSQVTLLSEFRLDVDGCGAHPVGTGGPVAPDETTPITTTVVLGPPPPAPPPPPPPDGGGNACGGNCGLGVGGGGGNGTGNEGNGRGPKG
jgi:hypothetical protein